MSSNSESWNATERTRLLGAVRTHGTPLYAYSERIIRERARQFMALPLKLPFRVFYAMKANASSRILRLLRSEGLGVDIVSGGELEKANAAGFTPEEIIFSGVGKTDSELDSALHAGRRGILSVNVESESELIRLDRLAQKAGRRVRFALRFNPDIDARTHPHITTGREENKFGVSRHEILRLMKRVDRLRGLEWVGLSIHIGSQITEVEPLRKSFQQAARLLSELHRVSGTTARSISVGGGLGVAYRGEKTITLRAYARAIDESFRDYARMTGDQFQVFFEPGRAILATAGVLATSIVCRKKNGRRTFLVVDAGMNDFIRPALYSGFHEISVLRAKRRKAGQERVDIVGPVCESADAFGRMRIVPKGLTEGDELLIHDAGAYGFSMSSHYNQRPKPAEILIQKNGIQLIRGRETWQDEARHEIES